MTPIQLSRRGVGGAQIVQGHSYIMLNRHELQDLIVDLINLHGMPERVEMMVKGGDKS
ncbi:hypothetical protein [Mycolicibacterium peregrinum]|uniref:hypothetical protein n=1 Tax=Mycolicibacterium peregrinum TaxID=43304 RepID=UPI000A47BD6A|nr:hypothetical protein [Mycolicibacterium peregrinum]